MFCPNCGNQVDENCKFCNSCGQQLGPQALSNTLQQDVATKNSVPNNGSIAKNSNKALIGVCIGAAVIAVALIAFIIVSFVMPKNNISGINMTGTSNANKDTERFERVLAEYNTVYKQGNIMAWRNPKYTDMSWSSLTKPLFTELRSEGYQYLPSDNSDLPSKYCFRDVNDDGQNELIVGADKYGVLGVYYFNEEDGTISYDPKFCNNTVPYDYEKFEAYLTEDNKLVEIGGHNDHALVRDISANPSKNIVDYYNFGGTGFADKAGTLPQVSNFTQVEQNIKNNYQEDTSVEWINFDGTNCAEAKSVSEWWTNKTPTITGVEQQIISSAFKQIK